MQLSPFVDDLRTALLAAAESGGEESREVARHLLAPLDSAARLVLLAAVSAAADEITRELAPTAIEVRLRGVEPEFVINAPPEPAPPQQVAPTERLASSGPGAGEADDGSTVRTTLRLPDHLKQRVEEAAARAGLSVNTWLVRAIAEAVDAAPPSPSRPAAVEGRRLTGWAH